MRAMKSMAAVLTATVFTFAVAAPASAQDRRREEMSTTEKVIAGVTVAAVAGLAIYALTRDDDQDRYNRRDRRDYRDQRGYDRSHVALGFQYESYSYGGPDYRGRDREPEGYWCRVGDQRFYRVPYRYNPRYDRAFNAGWERGYWAGYLQGVEDARWRSPYRDSWDQRGGMPWGYSSGYGPQDSYRRAFDAAYRIGYRHGVRGERFGSDNFGIGFEVRFRR